MADRSGFSTQLPQMRLTGRGVQIQTQRMSQQQILSLNLLAMGSSDLREAIYKKVAENPALEIVKDAFAAGPASTVKTAADHFSDNTRYGSSSAQGAAASDSFQAALESEPDMRISLQDHLEMQFNAMKHRDAENIVGLRLIHNLDRSGFHLLAPVSLLDKSDPDQTPELLAKCIDCIQRLDPVGTCCSGISESLLVQARLRENPPRAALFLLDGHLNFLDPPQPAKVFKKIAAFVHDRTNLTFFTGAETNELEQIKENGFSLEEIEDAIKFIRSLDPYPARNFGSNVSFYIAPDVYVTKIPVADEIDDDERGIVATTEPFCFKISLAKETVPQVGISAEFKNYLSGAAGGSDRKFAATSVRDAKVFIESIQYRDSTIAKACTAIVRAQVAFFSHGPRYLVPLRQRDIAELIGVHETTVSRMASEKYLQCEWGLFKIGYFFTNAVSEGDHELSKEAVKFEILKILKNQAEGEKPFSDQKIADCLCEQGISIARRTVAKYRAELALQSSYSR
jgi:RNA polymerase sigma-54 factor